MLHWVCLGLVWFLHNGICNDQALADTPTLQFEQVEYHFGFAGQNRDIVHRFRFKNAGTGDLLIKAIKSTCACQVTVPTSKTFVPGQTDTITVTCKTGRRIGQITETIRVLSNDPEHPEIELKIAGSVKADYALDPEFLSFGEVAQDLSLLKSIRFMDVGDGTLELRRVETPDEYLLTHMSKLEDEPLHGYLIQVALNPEAPVGPFVLPITLHTNLKKRPRIDIPVTGHILGPLRVDPAVMRLGSLLRGQSLPVTKTITVTSHAGEAFELVQWDCQPTVLQAMLVSGPKAEHAVSLKVPMDAPLGPFQGHVRIHTGHPKQSLVSVMVTGLIAAAAAETSSVPKVKSTLYVTRMPTEEDTYVAAWLIKRFIDPTAVFSFIQLGTALPKQGILFDLPSSRIRWRRTHNRCTSENVFADMKASNAVQKKMVMYMARLERASWLVSPNSDAGRLRAWIRHLNTTVNDPQQRMKRAFKYLDKIYAVGAHVP